MQNACDTCLKDKVNDTEMTKHTFFYKKKFMSHLTANEVQIIIKQNQVWLQLDTW